MQFHARPPADVAPGPAWICENPACDYRILEPPADAISTATAAREARRIVTERARKTRRASMKTWARSERLKRDSAELKPSSGRNKKTR
jgi:hypothetical protein